MPRRVRVRHAARASHVTPLPSHSAAANLAPPPQHPSVDIAYSVVGDGPQLVLFIPGMCVSSVMWHNQLAYFSSDLRYTLLLMDNRGAGHSTLPRASSHHYDGYDIHTMARDALALVDFVFGSSAAFHLVGHSMGSMIAQRLALLPSVARRVSSLALLSGHDGGWFWNNVPTAHMLHAAFDMLRAGFDDFMATKVHVRLHYTEPFLNSFTLDDATGNKVLRRNIYYKRYLEGIRREKQRDHANRSFWAHLQAVRTHCLSQQDAKRFHLVDFPKIVVYGRSDPVVLPRASRGLAQRIGAQCVQLPGSHFIVDECASHVNRLLERLFESAPKRSFTPPTRQPLLMAVTKWQPCTKRPQLDPLDDANRRMVNHVNNAHI